jgi:ribosomal protein S21
MGVKVELKNYNPNADREDKDRAFKYLLNLFKRYVNDSGILIEYKQRQFYESPGEKRRRKRKEAAAERQKEKLRDHFINKSGENTRGKK